MRKDTMAMIGCWFVMALNGAFMATMVAGCEEDSQPKTAVIQGCGCDEGEICGLDGKCYDRCETSYECFSRHGGGWVCEDPGYCTFDLSGSIVPGGYSGGGSYEGEGEEPTEGEGENPTEGEGENPAEGEGEDPTEGEGEDCVPEFEACDGRDNDCDELIDEGYDFFTDEENCGACGIECFFPNATAECHNGNCFMVQCFDNFEDIDPAIPGCEYPCVPTNGGVEICDGMDNNCGGVADEGFNLLTDPDNCGRCGHVCELSNSEVACVAGECRIAQCELGFEDCDGLRENGCEVDLSSNINNCLECGHVCEFENSAGTCVDGFCVKIDECQPGTQDCNGDQRDGCESDLNNDVESCGACGTACEFANASAVCELGICRMTECLPGWADCDGFDGNGCEKFLADDPDNCGVCGTTCDYINGVGQCNAGQCELVECEVNFDNCNNVSVDGCETNLRDNVFNCGGCGTVCEFENTGATCVNGFCLPAEGCLPGFADCDGDIRNGCETDLNSDSFNCGSCDTGCEFEEAGQSCVHGICRMDACDGNFADCNTNWFDGCESDQSTDVNHCGDCETRCEFEHAGASCEAGQCKVGQCDLFFFDCDGDSLNGCETDVRDDINNCGSCGGQCDFLNTAEICVAGLCVATQCDPATANCDGAQLNGCETNLLNDIRHCGSCRKMCEFENSGAECVDGVCAPTQCVAGFADCNDRSGDGCETLLADDLNNCGQCGNDCAFANAEATCVAGACVMGACQLGFADCDLDSSNGCEVDLTNDFMNCRMCGHSCALPNAEVACVDSACVMVGCELGFGDCDEAQGNGCEKDLRDDSRNCGGCGEQCQYDNAEALCVDGDCRLAMCRPNYHDCDHDFVNGCESMTLSDESNCGRCGNVCNFPNGIGSCELGVCKLSACELGFEDCDGDPSNGCEIDVRVNLNNCGVCGRHCDFTNSSEVCEGGLCIPSWCDPGFMDCNNDHSDSCESNLLIDDANCGGCGQVCDYENAGSTCVNGVCRMDACVLGFLDCNTQAGDGCEVQPAEDVMNCGACRNACSFAHAEATCVAGGCVMGECEVGFADCDHDPSNGCEADLQSDEQNCRVCGNVCQAQNAGSSCVEGSCVMEECVFGFGNCDGDNRNGCEIEVRDDADHCGQCDNECSYSHAEAICRSGDCELALCHPNYRDCNTNWADGCEKMILSDSQNCGGCGQVCNFPHAVSSCVLGVCTMGACLPGFDDCDGDPSNGCEADLNANINHCGVCNSVCDFAGSGENCVAGICRSTQCDPGRADCDRSLQNGCESDLYVDALNCGGCGNSCDFENAGSICVNGVCRMTDCAQGFVDCNDFLGDGCEVRPEDDQQNCGLCDNVCSFPNASASCVAGACVMGECQVNYANCDGDNRNGCETDLRANLNHCGGCNTVCDFANSAEVCQNGICQPTICRPGFDNCDGVAGCESNLLIDELNCGGCGLACDYENAGATCVNGACRMDACVLGFLDCNTQAGDGCEVQPAEDVMNCGACRNACSFAHAEATCVAGGCVMGECEVGFADCNHDSADGCEVDLGNNINDCGQCGQLCDFFGEAEICMNGLCQPTECELGRANCDGTHQNGCESDLSSDPLNCGGCGNDCTFQNADAICLNGLCAMTVCDVGYADCNDRQGDGCEVQHAFDEFNCGACDNRCEFQNGFGTCNGGVCVLSVCQVGFEDCDLDPSNGCEVNLRNNLNNCGGCGLSCGFPNSGSICLDGICQPTACLPGFANCDGLAGCEADLNFDEDNCGSCHNECFAQNGNAQCVLGVCQQIACVNGFADCNGRAFDGCEANLADEELNCGGCGIKCSFPNAEAACVNGACVFNACLPWFRNINGNLADGCEYSCVPTHGGIEQCDGIDNDCDGQVDEVCPAIPESITCDICCAGGGDEEVVWFGNSPPFEWHGPANGCGRVTMPTKEICKRGPHPSSAVSGWVDWTCYDGANWGGWVQDSPNGFGVLSCVDENNNPVSYHSNLGTVDPRGEAELIFDYLCP